MKYSESENIELKREYTPDIKKEIIAFANTDGDRFELARSMDQELTFEAAGKEFAKRKIDFGKTQMKTLGIINADGLYTNLGLLLSDQCAHTIKIACFEGTRKSEFKDRREFEGSILRQLQDSYEYINMFNKIHATYSGLDRIDRRDYPEVAIREALLNAIVHRDYSFSGSTLISIFEDRIEFVSLGGLVAGLSIDDIMNGASQARNEKLANLFYRLKLVEAYGTGIIKIIESYEESPAGPKLKATDNAFNISIPNLNFAASDRQADSDDNMNEQWKMILNSIAKKGSVTRQETEKILGIGQTRAHVLLKAMIDAGMIKTVGDGKKRRYVRK